MSEILARRSLRNEHLGKRHDKKGTPAKQHGMWQKIFKLKAEDKATFYSLVKTKGTCASLQKRKRKYDCG